MGRPLAAAAAAAAAASPRGLPAFLFLALACLAALLSASEPRLRPPNATDVQRPLWKGRPEQTPPNRGPPALAKSGLQGGNGSTAAQEEEDGAAEAQEESQSKPAAVLLPGTGRGEGVPDPEAAGMTPNGDDTLLVRYFSEEGEDGERNASGLCLSCPAGDVWEATLTVRRGESGPMEALSQVTRFARPFRDGAPQKEIDGKDGPGSQTSVPEGQEEAGSGDQQARHPPNKGSWARGTPLTPSLHIATENGSVSHDSAETDLLLLDTVGSREAPAAPTESSGPHQISEQPPRGGPDQDSAQKEEPLELWVEASSHPPTLDGTDWTGLELGTPQSVVTPLVQAGRTPKPSSDPSASEIIDIDYYDLFDGEALGEVGAPEGGQGKPPKEKGTSWSLHDLYDDFTPFDESDFYPTTSFYTDGDEEDLEEPEEEEEEDEDDEDDGGGGLEKGLEDENDYRAPTLATPKIQTVALEAEPTSRRYLVPPLQTFVISGGGHGAATSRPRPAEAGRDLSLSGGSNENGTTECRSGYIRHNNSCKSVCDAFPSYCYNGGQCYLVENLGAFCRCNTQDYIWHKGMRCESIVTDFQVMCVAVGSAALVVLLLFMMTVFFAKKLYLLKTENNKLRKTKYRTPSELHNDNFSLSTIAEGSHPNEDPNALHKLQDPLKSCLKEEESFNIQNSMSPKLDHGKGDLDDSEVNCLQNNLT